MTTFEGSSPPTGGLLNDDLIELEPTMMYEQTAPAPAYREHAVGLVEGTAASLSGEIRTLQRSRLGSASLILVLLYALLVTWNLTTGIGSLGHVLLLMGARLAIAAVVAGLCYSSVPLAAGRLRQLEYVLFGGMTLLLLVSQCLINSELLRAGDLDRMIVYVKNGMIQLFVLMTLYGMYIPNNARSAARMVLTMALVVPLVAIYLGEQTDIAEIMARYRSIEHVGANTILALIGATLAIYGAHVLNGLRTELHEARKFGQYQLRQKIGAGGMGEVYLAEHELLKRPCAIKLIRPGADANPVALARFEREVQSAARLSHPNTIEIYDYGHTEDGTFYYVMEYLPGLSLGELIPQFGPLPAGRLIYLMRQACAGLAEAHALGLIHRDLKPANLFVAHRGGEYDVAKVLDFGLVKNTQDAGARQLTADQTVSGTPSFMSPEQATGDRSLDLRADLYSLGAMCYYALTGHPPFQGESAMAIMISHARDPVVPPSQLRPEVPHDLQAVVLRCLAKKPEDRYPDARTLAKALASCESAGDWDADKAEQWWTTKAREPAPQAGS